MIKPVTILNIELIIAKAAGISVKQLNSNNRQAHIVDARHAVWYVAHKGLGLGTTHIGRLYNRDHSTVMHAIDKLEKHGTGEKVLKKIKDKYPSLFIDTHISKTNVEAWRI